MARVIGRLAALQVDRLGAGMHADGGGLYLCVGKATARELEQDPDAKGARSWIFRYMRDRRAREMGLGPVHTVGLAEARKRAAAARLLLLDGGDPIEARRGERIAAAAATARAMNFRQCAEAYIAGNRAGWKNAKHAAQWEATLKTYVYPVFGALPVAAIDTPLVVKALSPIWTSKTETATRVRGRIEAVLDWARVSGYRDGENPARLKGHLDMVFPAPSKAKRALRQARGQSEHHAALPYDAIAGFVAELRGHDGSAARALEFAILTAARTGEVLGARWSEIDLVTRVWTIPADRMKAGKEHRVPLSEAALQICANAQTDADAYLFPGAAAARPLSNMALLMLLRRMGRNDLTAHGFRSTFRDWAAERTGFPAEVAEMALAHAIPDKVEAAYRRGDLLQKRRQLMEAWARFCAQPAAGGGAVVALRA